ncbi:hydroxymethylbilane synthase [Propionibacteriaceae bacterium Y1700]|uniref:hydroxymethylbilane synthase n=1 Tax=Microlunatus sp. Y1700 TaxID=3418487 RepID=UPI003DA78881
MTMAPVTRIRIGARTSPLARAQADQVAALLTAAGAQCEFVGVTTTGDTDRRHLTEIGGTGVFAQAVREALRTGEIDLAVHSLKDLPTAPAEGLEVVAHPVREDVRDLLVGSRLDDLPDGARVGTGSPRRAAQLHAWAAATGRTVEAVPVRGNVDRRIGLAASGELDAVLLAAAGLNRLGRVPDLPTELLPLEVMLPAAGQGALALEMSLEAPAEIRALVAGLDDPATRAAVTAERGFLAALEAGCLAPAGAAAEVNPGCGIGPDLTMAVVVGRTWVGGSATGGLIRAADAAPRADALALGERLAHRVLAELGTTHDTHDN